MTDFFSWCPISLGRWNGTQVRVHLLFPVFIIFAILQAAWTDGHSVAPTAAWLGLLVLAVVVHEMAHASLVALVGAEPEEVRLWPLGNLSGPNPPSPARWNETLWVAVAGPAVSLVLALAMAVAVNLAGGSMVFNPFGNRGTLGAPMLAGGHAAAPFTPIWWVGWFGYLNWVIALANCLIPALPFDAGKVLRSILASPSAGQGRESMAGPHTASACAILLFLVGLGRLVFTTDKEGAVTLIGLAGIVYFAVRAEARNLEEGGYYDEGLFGYDFSEGYTSLEGSTQKVRPYRESALKRWRRRRSEVRRQRRLAQEAAEEQRMDEILAKLHSQGRTALTDEEQRFLIRVSAKVRGRLKARESS